MINVKIDKGTSTMTFAGSGLELTAEICAIVHVLYTQMCHRAGPAIAKGCKKVMRDMLAREDSPVWDVNLDKNAGHSFFLEGDTAAAMAETATAQAVILPPPAATTHLPAAHTARPAAQPRPNSLKLTT